MTNGWILFAFGPKTQFLMKKGGIFLLLFWYNKVISHFFRHLELGNFKLLLLFCFLFGKKWLKRIGILFQNKQILSVLGDFPQIHYKKCPLFCRTCILVANIFVSKPLITCTKIGRKNADSYKWSKPDFLVKNDKFWPKNAIFS